MESKRILGILLVLTVLMAVASGIGIAKGENDYSAVLEVESDHPYANNYDHTWTIKKEGAKQIRIHFKKIETEKYDDYVSLYDASGYVAQYSGSYEDKWSEWYVGDTIKVNLKTDRQNQYYGFLVDKVETRTHLAPGTSHLAESDHPYANNYDHTWTVKKEGAKQIRIHFKKIETEKYDDYVSLYDASGYVAQYSGSYEDKWSEWYVGDTIKVNLKTDRQNQYYGFLVDKVETRTHLAPGTSHLAESDHPYANNYDHTWTIKKEGAKQIRIHFKKIETEKYDDYVSLYDASRYLAQYSGSYEDKWSEWYVSDTIKVNLKTDRQNQYYGFLVDKVEIRPPTTPTPKLPSPSVSSDTSSLQMQVEGVKEITFTVTNKGGNSAADSYLSVSVSSGLQIVDYSCSSSDMKFKHSSIGSEIWNSEGKLINSEYELLDAFEAYSAGETNTVTIKVKATASGSQWIKYRTAFDTVESGYNFIRNPTSGLKDQQGWHVYEIPVEVTTPIGPRLHISTDKVNYYPNEMITINAEVTDLYGSCIHLLSKDNFKIFMDETEVNSGDITFEVLSCTNYNLKITAPSTEDHYTIEVVVDTTLGTESEILSISVRFIDSDNDGLPDYEEDKNHNGIYDPPGETDLNNKDTDRDTINDKDDPYPWKTENRKALIVGIMEYNYLWGIYKDRFPNRAILWQNRTAIYFRRLGFTVTEHIDYDNEDGNVITYNDVSDYVTNFVNTLNSDDVALVYISSHGHIIGDTYYLWYGNDFYNEEQITWQLEDIGTYLDFLWLHTCYSWGYQDQIDDLGAGGIIFFGADGETRDGNQDDFYNAILAEKFVESTIDNIGTNDNYYNFSMDDQYQGNMNLMDPLLTHKSPIIHQSESEEPAQTPNEAFTTVNSTIWDSDGDSVKDAVTISWAANTVFPQENVSVFAYVRSSSNKIVEQYIFGPYTIYGNSPEIYSFNFYSRSTDTYNIRLMLYDSSHNPVDIAFITNLSINAGPGGPGGDEEFTNTWFNTIDSNGDGIADTIMILWNADTTLPQENVSVLITVRDNVLKYGPYTIYNSLPNTGGIEFYVGDIGVYEVSLYLVDSNSEFEDSASLEVPIEVSKFADTYADYGKDTNDDGQYDYLTLDVGIDVSSAGNYSLRGSLFHEGEPIATVSNDLYLNEGIQTVQLNFDGETLYKSGIDGRYELRYLELHSDGTFMGHRNRACSTAVYDHTQFQAPVILFNDFNDYGVDVNSNGLFDYLRINANVSVATAGNYTLSGCLYDANGNFVVSVTNFSYLDTGLQTFQLDFDGYTINYNRKQGPYNLAVTAYNDSTYVNSKDDAYLTKVYNYTQFETRLIPLDMELITPLEVLLSQTADIAVVITNPSSHALTNLQASLVLPSEFNTTDPTIINIADLNQCETKEVKWALKSINPGYGEITVNVTSLDIQNLTITRGIIVTNFALTVETDKKTYTQGENMKIITNTTNENSEVS